LLQFKIYLQNEIVFVISGNRKSKSEQNLTTQTYEPQNQNAKKETAKKEQVFIECW
jgi:hypothetical protein